MRVRPDRRADWLSPAHLSTLLLVLITAICIWLCYRLAAPFLPALVWAGALAVLFSPLQHWLELKLPRAHLATPVCLLLIALLVVVPVIFVVQQLALQAASSAQLIEAKIASGEWRRAIGARPYVGPLLDRLEAQMDLPGALQLLNERLNRFAGSLLRGSLFQLIGLAITFYVLFYFLRDRQVVLKAIERLSPLSAAEMQQLYAEISNTVHATIYGTLAVASIQGLLGGLMFWWLGLPAPLLWGLVMALLAVVPVLGAFVVWLPAALFLLLEGSWERALILAAWGVLVVGTVDNLLRPLLVGSRLKLHTLLVFVSVVGGLIVFGAAGMVLGPVTLTVTLVLLQYWSAQRALVLPQAANEPLP